MKISNEEFLYITYINDMVFDVIPVKFIEVEENGDYKFERIGDKSYILHCDKEHFPKWYAPDFNISKTKSVFVPIDAAEILANSTGVACFVAIRCIAKIRSSIEEAKIHQDLIHIENLQDLLDNSLTALRELFKETTRVTSPRLLGK